MACGQEDGRWILMFLDISPYGDRIDVAKDTRHGFRYFRHIIRSGCMLDARMLRTAVDAVWWG
jgi:hypothetical protein